MKRYLLLLICFSCVNTENRLEKRRMDNNLSSEKIYRLSNETIYKRDKLSLVQRDSYPWESNTDFPKITIDAFRCKGSIHNKEKRIDGELYGDCKGIEDHGLPYLNGREHVYPALIKLLNKIQNHFQQKVVISSAHRCPKHNRYLLKKSIISRYMIGAKVDFYLEGLGNSPESIVDYIMSTYRDDEFGYNQFHKMLSRSNKVIWKNKELILSIEKHGEHSIIQKLDIPVVSVEVYYDRQLNEPIRLDWKRAHHGFIIN